MFKKCSISIVVNKEDWTRIQILDKLLPEGNTLLSITGALLGEGLYYVTLLVDMLCPADVKVGKYQINVLSQTIIDTEENVTIQGIFQNQQIPINVPGVNPCDFKNDMDSFTDVELKAMALTPFPEYETYILSNFCGDRIARKLCLSKGLISNEDLEYIDDEFQFLTRREVSK